MSLPPGVTDAMIDLADGRRIKRVVWKDSGADRVQVCSVNQWQEYKLMRIAPANCLTVRRSQIEEA